MEKRDARSLTPKTQEEIRRQAIRLLKSLKPREVAEQLEVSRNAVYEWIKAHKAGGMKALKAKRQGRPKGAGQTLSEEQQGKIRVIICDATPDQLKMPFALWTREAIASLIKDLFKIKSPAVLGAVIHLGNRFDFMDVRSTRILADSFPKFIE